jgi:acetyl-CoA carboxylase biotin carboxyl carrier protein
MDLTEDDVFEILKLFEQSKFNYIHIEQGELKLTVSKDGYVHAETATAPAAPAVAAAAPAAGSTSTAAAAPSAAPAAAVEVDPVDEGLFTVTAPMVGTFYSAPSPSDPPYVELGGRVEADATLGLIEVMKVYTAAKSDVAGTVEKILVANAETIEFGQPLFLIRPDA